MAGTLIGRDGALARVRAVLDEHGVAVVGGASGIGKTALADAVAAEWADDGRALVEIRATHGLRLVPFGAVAVYLDGVHGETTTETANRIAAAITSHGEVLVSVDDVHLLDEQSAGLLVSLTARPGVRLLMTAAAGHPVPPDVASLWARRPDCRIELEPLTPSEVDDLALRILGADAAPRTLEAIRDATLGYPLFVTALATELRDRPTDDPDSLPTDTPRLLSLFERQVARLGREERRILDLIAFAESLPSDALTIDTDGHARALADAGFVRVRAGRLEAAHPLLAEVALATLTPDGRRSSARALLEAVAGLGSPDDVFDAVRRALDVGVVPEVGCLEIAARAALDVNDFEAVEWITSHAPDKDVLVPLRARALRHLGEVPDGLPTTADEDARVQVLTAQAQALAFVERRFSDAIQLLRRGLVGVREPTARHRLAMELMVFSGLAGDLESLLGAARSIDREADSDTRLMAEATTLLAEGLTLATTGSDDTYRRGRQLIDGGVVGDAFLEERLEMSRALVDLAEGRLSSARQRCEFASESAAPGSWGLVESLLADAWQDAEGARATAARAVEELDRFDPLGNLPQAQLLLAMRAAQSGDSGALESVPADVPDSETGVANVDRMMRRRVEAWALWAAGDPTAGKVAASAGREALALGHRFWGLCTLLDASRLGVGGDVAPDIEHLVVTRGAGLAALAARHARAETAEQWHAVAKSWWQAGASTYAVEAAIEAADLGAARDRAAVQLLAARGARPLVRSLDEVEPVLTDRQVQVVLGILDGSSNREVAESLFLAKRTVDNHLRLAYEALGSQGDREGVVSMFGWIGGSD